MSEQEWTTDSDSDGSDEIHSAKKSLPWHSMDLVKRQEPISSANVLSSESSSSLATSELDKLRISSDDQISPNTSTSFPRNALPWDGKLRDTPATEINLLLLGESGVGKSTFINSFANYMKHENFEAVQKNMLSVLIPARFNIFDKKFKKHTIEIGANDENEVLADGAAATQDVKTYVFHITLENKVYLIRLIDTPGMGDPRGIDQDNKNCDLVLNYLGRLEKIHAICLLLKPTNTRLDVFLNYCVIQILSRLEKSATDNIAFLFTNTRGQNYTPGETYISLEVLVEKIKKSNNVTLPLSHENVFCFDNEAFRFLASIKQGVEFKEGILEANIESWKYSYKEVYRLISYVVQLKPHDPQKTISINHARKMVLQLAQPLAEIVQLIGDNIYQLDQHTNQLLMENQTLDELKQKLYMPVIDIRAIELPKPVTVCTAPQCSTIYKVAEKNKFHYKQRCHNPCYLNNVPAEIVGDPHLLECWAISKSTQSCHQCGCRFNTHMHIYYETDTFENKIVDENVQKNIHTKEDATREKQVVINRMLNHKEQLEKEHKYIIKCSAAFAHFLQQNAITPINDSLKEYVKYLITREENLGRDANRATLDYLRRLLSEYEQEKNVLEEALKQGTSGIVSSSPNIIEGKIRELFTLPNFGTKIKELYDLHQSGGVVEYKQSEFVVKEQYTLSIMDKFKSVVMGAFGMGKSRKQHRLEMEHQRALEYQKYRELEFYKNQLQRQEWHPHKQSTLRFNGQNGNQFYFGPNEPRNRNRRPYYGWDEEEYFLPSDGEDLHRQYALEYEKRDETDFEARRQYFAGMAGGQGPDDRQVALNYKEKDTKQSGFSGEQAPKSEITKNPSYPPRFFKNTTKGSTTAQPNAESEINGEGGTKGANKGKWKNVLKTSTGAKNKKNKNKNKKK